MPVVTQNTVGNIQADTSLGIFHTCPVKPSLSADFFKGPSCSLFRVMSVAKLDCGRLILVN